MIRLSDKEEKIALDGLKKGWDTKRRESGREQEFDIHSTVLQNFDKNFLEHEKSEAAGPSSPNTNE